MVYKDKGFRLNKITVYDSTEILDLMPNFPKI